MTIDSLPNGSGHSPDISALRVFLHAVLIC